MTVLKSGRCGGCFIKSAPFLSGSTYYSRVGGGGGGLVPKPSAGEGATHFSYLRGQLPQEEAVGSPSRWEGGGLASREKGAMAEMLEWGGKCQWSDL